MDQRVASLRTAYEQWTAEWEGVAEDLDRFEADHRRYAEEAAARRGELLGARPEPFHGWWGREFASFADRLSRIAGDLVPVASALAGRSPAVIVAPWPGRGLHARTARAADGYVVLVNTLTMPLLHTVAWIAAGNAARLFPAAAQWSEDPLDDASTARFLALCVKAALDDDEPHVVPPDEWTGARANLQDILVNAALEFVVAHELAHVVGGHLDDPQNRTLLDVRFAAPTESAVLWNIRLEMDADRRGTEILLAHWNHRIGLMGRVRGAIAGPLFLLGFQLLVDHARASIWDDWGETHPSAFMRGSSLLHWLADQGLGDVLGDARSVAEWFWDEKEVVAEQLTGGGDDTR